MSGLKYRDYAPALKYGAKIYPEDLAGMIGLPSVGNIWYVDPGKSVSGGGTSRADAFITVLEGYNAATADQDDVVLITPSSSTGRTTEAAAIVWAKRRTHLIGSTAPTRMNPRAGMSFGSAVATPSMTISTRSCIFKNITIAQFNDVESNVMVELTGDYNYFEGVHFAGMGNELTGNDALARSLQLTGAEENRFAGCTFGLDTVLRTAANASVGLTSMSARNSFEDCLFVAAVDAGAPFHVLAKSGGVDRWVHFKGCSFINADVTGGVSTMTDVVSNVGGHNDLIWLDDCTFFGATGLTSDTAGVYNSRPAANATGGISTVATS